MEAAGPSPLYGPGGLAFFRRAFMVCLFKSSLAAFAAKTSVRFYHADRQQRTKPHWFVPSSNTGHAV